MSDILVSRNSLTAEARQKIETGKMGVLPLVDFAEPALSGRFGSMSQDQKFGTIEKLSSVDRHGNAIEMAFKNGVRVESAGFDVDMSWADGTTKSVRQAINDGMFSPSMSSNTLPADWDNLWDAMRINVTVRKAALPTIRQFIYNVTTDPNFTRELRPTEISPFGVVFEENNGHGEAIPMGETLGGGYDVFYILIYAAGFTWDLMAELFDKTITPERVMDAVMVGYNAIKDDIAISPILNFTYSGVQQTAANTTSGAERQELLYLTLEDAIDDLGDRENPVTERNLDVSNVVVLANPYDARHIARVANGLPSTNQKSYPAISEISQVLSYDDEVIRLRDRTVTYSGVTKGTAYMLIPASSLDQGYMEIAVKRDLMVEVDQMPDLKTLTREQRAYWFGEGIWYEGIQYFVQEITLPTW